LGQENYSVVMQTQVFVSLERGEDKSHHGL